MQTMTGLFTFAIHYLFMLFVLLVLFAFFKRFVLLYCMSTLSCWVLLFKYFVLPVACAEMHICTCNLLLWGSCWPVHSEIDSIWYLNNSFLPTFLAVPHFVFRFFLVLCSQILWQFFRSTYRPRSAASCTTFLNYIKTSGNKSYLYLISLLMTFMYDCTISCCLVLNIYLYLCIKHTITIALFRFVL